MPKSGKPVAAPTAPSMTPLHGALYRFFGIDKRHNVAKRNVQLFEQIGLASLASHVRNTEFHSGAEMSAHAWLPEKLGAAVGRAEIQSSVRTRRTDPACVKVYPNTI